MGWRKTLSIAAAVAVIPAVAWFAIPRGAGLPKAASYPRLPAQFAAALEAARSRASGGAPEAVRALAHLYQANSLYSEARACYGVLGGKPGGLSARDHYSLALIDSDMSDLDGERAELEAALAAEPRYIPARIALANTLFDLSRPDDAARQFSETLKLVPDQPQALYGLARVALQKGDDPGAIATLRTLVVRHPEWTTGAALLSKVLERRGEADDAAAMKALSSQTHEPVPPDPWAEELLALCYDLPRLGIAFERYRLSEQLDGALPLLARISELDPSGWMAPMLRGWSLSKAGHYADGVAEYRRSLANGGDPERICPLLVNALLHDKKASEAAAFLADYHARLPHSTPILLSYCEVAVRMKDDALARRLLLEVLAAEPDLYMPNMSLVQILWNGGDHDGAARYLRRVARVFPADVDSRGLLAQYYMERGDAWSAIPPLEQARAAAGPGDARAARLGQMLVSAYLMAGSLDASKGRLGTAVRYADKAVGIDPASLGAWALRMNACRALGDLKGQIEALGRMAQLKPGEALIQLDLGDALLKAGRTAEAEACWRRAVELAPSGPSQVRDEAASRLAAASSLRP